MQKELDKIEKNATMVVEQNMPKDAADALLKDVKVSETFRAATYRIASYFRGVLISLFSWLTPVSRNFPHTKFSHPHAHYSSAALFYTY